jgi:hypothetical protein
MLDSEKITLEVYDNNYSNRKDYSPENLQKKQTRKKIPKKKKRKMI